MSTQPFGDIPFFRELQRLLASSGGPLNLEIARQVAVAVSSQGMSDTDPPPQVSEHYSDGIKVAEPMVAGYARLEQAEPFAGEIIGRRAWADSTLQAWRWLLEHAAARLTAELQPPADPTDGGPGENLGQTPSENPSENPMEIAMTQMTSLLMGIQVGSAIGQLATESTGRYDPPVVRDDAGRLFVVWPNVAAMVEAYDFTAEDYLRWAALSDTARHLISTSVPWVERFHRSLLTDVVNAVEIDAQNIEQAFMELQSKGMEALQEGLGLGQVLPLSPTAQHADALARLRAFDAITQGFTGHVVDVVGPSALSAAPGGSAVSAKIEESISLKRLASGEDQNLLFEVMGVRSDPALGVAGKTFCVAIVELHGLPALARVWDAPDNLPTLDEVKDPFAWIERVLND